MQERENQEYSLAKANVTLKDYLKAIEFELDLVSL